MSKFSETLTRAVQRRGNPVVVGLDPRVEQLPASLVPGDLNSAACVAESFRQFCCEIIDVVSGLVPVVKPQFAFFEQLGSAGMRSLANVIAYAREKGLVVIGDAKRGDIGSTAEAYATAYLTENPLGIPCDSLTVNPYMGADTLQPFVTAANQHGTGIFVLVKTSNPGSAMLQDLDAENESIYRRVAAVVQQLAEESANGARYGSVGAVVGATYPEQLIELRAAMKNSWILVPGFGAQGGTASDVAPAFDESGLGAIVNNSRGIIFAHEKPEWQSVAKSNWQNAVEAATKLMVEQLRSDTTAGKLASN